MAADRQPQQSTGRALPSKDEDKPIAPQGYNGELGKAQDLYDTVNKALTTTVNGEFFEGTKSSNANRHRQLPEIFQLRDQLGDLVESVTKKERLLVEQERIKNEGSSRPAVSSATLQAMVQSAVQQQLAKELRDLQIKNERLDERLAKMEAKQPVTIDGAKKVKKLPPPNHDDVKVLQRRVAALEAERKHSKVEMDAQKDRIGPLKSEVTTLRHRTDSHGMDIAALKKLAKTASTVNEQVPVNGTCNGDGIHSDACSLQ